ncbi:MAG: thioredoxin [Clostridiales bacterium]|nr:thioredoxin [Clostridiales bacterium]
MSIMHVTKDSFEKEVLKEEGLVLLDYWAPWCMPCKMLSPILEQIAKEDYEVKICKINVDEEPELADKNNVMNIPMLQVLKNGDVIKKSVGFIPKSEIIKLIQ